MLKNCEAIKSAEYIDAVIGYTETLLGIGFKNVRKNRFNSICPFHSDIKDSFMMYVNKKDEVRFHCFGACKGDWDIYDLIMLRKKCGFRKAQQVWAEHLNIMDFKSCDSASPCIPEPGETPEPDDTVGFAEPEKLDENIAAALDDAAGFYNDLLLSNKDRFKHIWDYLACRGIGKEIISRFKIGYAPPYSDEQHQGRALITRFLPRFEKNFEAFNTFSDSGLIRFLNDKTVRGYGYYLQQIDFSRNDPISRNYSDYFAGQIVFPIYDINSCITGFAGRRPGDRGVRWLKHQNREIALSSKRRLYGIEKAKKYIQQHRTIIFVEGIFDYFAFYNLLRDQDNAVVVSTLGSYLILETADILKNLDIKHFIVAYDWDELGRNGIERLAFKSQGWVYFLGAPAEGQTPYDMLKSVVSAISGFSLKKPETDLRFDP